MNDDKFRKIDKFTEGFIRKSARRLAGKYGFKRHDRDEIEQQLYLKLAKHLDAADPDDPQWKAFVAKTVRRHLASMIRDNQAEKRDHRRVCSIHVSIESEEGTMEPADLLRDSDKPAHRGCVRRSEQELLELILDVTECIADIPDERLRDFCMRLRYDSISQIARDMDLPRTTLNAWLAKVRSRFENRGLKAYLKP